MGTVYCCTYRRIEFNTLKRVDIDSGRFIRCISLIAEIVRSIADLSLNQYSKVPVGNVSKETMATTIFCSSFNS